MRYSMWRKSNFKGRGFKASEAEKQEEIMHEMKVWKMWVLTVESFLKSEYSKIKESDFENYKPRLFHRCERWAFKGPLLCTHFSISDWSMCRSSMPLSLPGVFFLYHCFKIPMNFLISSLGAMKIGWTEVLGGNCWYHSCGSTVA